MAATRLPGRDGLTWFNRPVVGYGVVVIAWSWITQADLRRSTIWFDEAFTVVWSRVDWSSWWLMARLEGGNAALQSAAFKVADEAWPGRGLPVALMELLSAAMVLLAAISVMRMLGRAAGPWLPMAGGLCLLGLVNTRYIVTELRPYGAAMAVTAATVELMARERLPVRRLAVCAAVGPLLHPLLCLTSACALVRLGMASDARRLALRWSLLPIASCGFASVLVVTNPRGTSQVAWLPPIGLDLAIGKTARFLGANTPWGWAEMPRTAAAAAGLVAGLLVAWATASRIRALVAARGATSGPRTTPDRAFVISASVMASTIAVLAAASRFGPVGYLGNYRYLLNLLPLWTVVLVGGSARLLTAVARHHRATARFAMTGALVVATTLRVSDIVRSPRGESDSTVSVLTRLLDRDRAQAPTGIVLNGFQWYIVRANVLVGRLTIPPPYELTGPLDNCEPEPGGFSDRRWRFAPSEVFGSAEAEVARYQRVLVQPPEPCMADIVARWTNAEILDWESARVAVALTAG